MVWSFPDDKQTCFFLPEKYFSAPSVKLFCLSKTWIVERWEIFICTSKSNCLVKGCLSFVELLVWFSSLVEIWLSLYEYNWLIFPFLLYIYICYDASHFIHVAVLYVLFFFFCDFNVLGVVFCTWCMCFFNLMLHCINIHTCFSIWSWIISTFILN